LDACFGTIDLTDREEEGMKEDGDCTTRKVEGVVFNGAAAPEEAAGVWK